MKAQNQQTLDQLGGLAKRCRPKLLQRGPSRKQIWCTLKLLKSHWWQLFWVSARFTGERSKLAVANMTKSANENTSTVNAPVRRPRGGLAKS